MSDFSAGFMTGFGFALIALLSAFVAELFRDRRATRRVEQMSDAWKREAWRHHDLER